MPISLQRNPFDNQNAGARRPERFKRRLNITIFSRRGKASLGPRRDFFKNFRALFRIPKYRQIAFLSPQKLRKTAFFQLLRAGRAHYEDYAE